MRFHLTLTLVMAFLSAAPSAFAATLTIAPAGGSSYVLQAEGFNGVAAFDATIIYDPEVLTLPQVVQGSLANGALFIANPNIARQIRIAFVSTAGISGNGPIATINFVPPVGGSVTINKLLCKILNPQGVAIPLTVAISAPAPQNESNAGWSGGSFPQFPQPVTDKPTVTAPVENSKIAVAAGAAVMPGTLTVPGGNTPANVDPAKPQAAETVVPQPQPIAEKTPVQPVAEVAPVKPVEKVVLPHPPANVLERFRGYTGELSVAALKLLFVRQGSNWITQDPEIVVADGKSPVKLIINLERQGAEAPSFALNNLKSKSLQMYGEAGWLIESLPATDTVQASISMLIDGSAADIPITVVSRLPAAWAGMKLTEADVNRFLKDRGTEKVPAGDLNGDGRHDYIDDYIMIGNYLAAAKQVDKAPVPPVKQEPSAPSEKPAAK